MSSDTSFTPWIYFYPWNLNFDVKIAIPDVLYDFSANNDSDFELTFFNGVNEHNVYDNRNILLYGRNFSKNELITCNTNRNNIEIADTLEKLVSSDTNYLILDISSHIVGLSFELMSRDLFSYTVFYTNCYRRDMLIQNINLFNFANKSIVLGDHTDILIDERMQGCIVIINDIVEDDGVKYMDLQLSMKLEEFISVNSNIIYVFVLKYPEVIHIPGFDSNFVSGHTILINRDFGILPVSNNGGLNYFTDLALKNMLVKSIPVKKFDSPIFGEKLNNLIKEDFGLLNFEIKFTDQIPEGSLKTLLSKLTPLLPKNPNDDAKEKLTLYYKWVISFMKYLMVESKQFKDEEIKSMLQDIMSVENRKRYWVPSIINESYNVENNYEQLETLGDKVLGSTFAIYLMSKMPKITSESLNNIGDYYMSKYHQSIFCQELGLSNWIFSLFPLQTNIYEDVFESFSGAVYLASENARRGLGSILLYKFIEILFENRDIYSPEIAMGNKSMVINQYIQKLGKPVFIAQSYNTGNVFHNNIRINPKQLDFFAKNGIDTGKITTNPFVGKGSDKNAAKLESHTKLYNYLKSIGVTYEWVENYRTNRKLLNNKVNKELSAQAKVISVQQGYIKITPKIIEKYTEYMGIMLIGMTKEGKQVLLSIAHINKSNNLDNKEIEIMLMSQVLRKYIDENSK